jgi:integrase
MSGLDNALADYLALRRSLGHKLADAERQLRRFVTYLNFVGADTVTLDAALGFVLDPDVDPASSTPAKRLQAVRGFARYLAGVDGRAEVPPAGTVSYRDRRRRPFLFGDDEIRLLMATAAVSARTAHRAATLKTVIGLLAVTGMRVGEALRLAPGDVDVDDAVITVRASKFGKSRQVPVSPSTIEALSSYAELRDQAVPAAVTFFVTPAGAPLAYTHFGLTFRRAIDAAGIGAASATRPTVHDLRHSFAVRTLVRWHRDGLDVAALLPRLSTYLGHREPRYTYRYLSATPELLGHAARLLDAHQAARP